MADHKKPDVPKTVKDETKTGTDKIPDGIPRTCGRKPHEWVIRPEPKQLFTYCDKCYVYYYTPY